MLIVRSTPAYVVAYLVLMVPTYILPYAGSNSALVNGFSTAMGMGPTPQWWAHAWCLVMLVVLGWLRGNTIGKAFLPALPAVAALFDMTPGLSMVPLIPTLLHLAAIFFGAQVLIGGRGSPFRWRLPRPVEELNAPIPSACRHPLATT